MKIRNDYTCPLEIVHDIMKGKWKTILVFQLRNGNRTFSELRNDIEGISEKMLLQALKELREFGIVDKITSEGYPLHVEYFLTKRGRKMLQAIIIMQDIGIEYMIEHGQLESLRKKGFIPCCDILTKK